MVMVVLPGQRPLENQRIVQVAPKAWHWHRDQQRCPTKGVSGRGITGSASRKLLFCRLRRWEQPSAQCSALLKEEVFTASSAFMLTVAAVALCRANAANIAKEVLVGS